MKRYKKKPIEIEAIQFTGNNWKMIEYWSADSVYVRGTELPDEQKEMEMSVDTLEGQVRAKVGDYIIKGIRGEFYPCERTIFEESYEEVKYEINNCR